MKTKNLVALIVFLTSLSSWGQKSHRSEDSTEGEAIPTTESSNESLADFRFRVLICKAVEADDIVGQLFRVTDAPLNHTKYLIDYRSKLLEQLRPISLIANSNALDHYSDFYLHRLGETQYQYYGVFDFWSRLDEFVGAVTVSQTSMSLGGLRIKWTPIEDVDKHSEKSLRLKLETYDKIGMRIWKEEIMGHFDMSAGFDELGNWSSVPTIREISVNFSSVKVLNAETRVETKLVFNTERFINCVRDRGVVKKLIEELGHETPQ